MRRATQRGAIRPREMTQLCGPHEYHDPCSDQEEQLDDVMPEPTPKKRQHKSSTKPCDRWGKTQEAAARRSSQAGDEPGEHPSRCTETCQPSRSLSSELHHGRRGKGGDQAGTKLDKHGRHRTWARNVVAQLGKKVDNFKVSQAGWSTKEHQASKREHLLKTIGS